MESAFGLERFVALVRREFGAADVRVLGATEAASDAPNAVHSILSDGRTLVVTFSSVRPDREVVQRRLQILADTFSSTITSAHFRAARLNAPISLQDELRALAQRAQAEDILVIDVDSPIVWGSARSGISGPRRSEPPPLAEMSRPQLTSGQWDAPGQDDPSFVPIDPVEEAAADAAADRAAEASNVGPTSGASANTVPESAEPASAVNSTPAHAAAGLSVVDQEPISAGESEQVPRLSLDTRSSRTIQHFRGLAEVSNAAHRGKHVRHVHVESELGYLATSFSSIYVLLLVFTGEFDEVRAERAAQEALPRIERLVLALPPLDPEPEPAGQVMSFRRRKR